MKKTVLLCLLLLPLCIGGLRAEDDTAQFLEALAGMQELTGRFEQRQFSIDGALVQESRGNFRLLRPGYFSWEIEYPGSQLIIADPEFVWHYDRDLETVTRRPSNSGSGMSPMQVLGGDENALRQGFTVVHEGEGVFALEPRDGDPGFRRLRVSLRAFLIEQMEIVDNLNQQLLIQFDNLNVEAGLAPADFGFVPPPGIDTFYYDE